MRLYRLYMVTEQTFVKKIVESNMAATKTVVSSRDGAYRIEWDC